MANIKVVIVDDSAFARKVLRKCLDVSGVEVVGVANDGMQALELIEALAPDVIILDLVMPVLDGLGVLRALSGLTTPRVVVVAGSASEPLPAGAFRIVRKPTPLAVEELYAIGAELVEVVRAAARA